MKCEILRNPGLDLAYNLSIRADGPIEIPKDLAEGQTVDLADDVAEALIAVGVARQADKPEKPRGGKHEPSRHEPPKHPPAK